MDTELNGCDQGDDEVDGEKPERLRRYPRDVVDQRGIDTECGECGSSPEPRHDEHHRRAQKALCTRGEEGARIEPAPTLDCPPGRESAHHEEHAQDLEHPGDRPQARDFAQDVADLDAVRDARRNRQSTPRSLQGVPRDQLPHRMQQGEPIRPPTLALG